MADPMASVILARELLGLRRVILLPVLSPGGAGYISSPGFHGAHLPLPIDPPPAPPPARAMASVIAKRAIMPVSLLCPLCPSSEVSCRKSLVKATHRKPSYADPQGVKSHASHKQNVYPT